MLFRGEGAAGRHVAALGSVTLHRLRLMSINFKSNRRWRQIDALLALLALKDREWLARERSSASGASSQALRSVAISGPAAFAALEGLSRDQDPEAWICAAIRVLRAAEQEFTRAGHNDPDSFGSAIFGQVECELSQLFVDWTRRNPQSRYDANRLRTEVLESFDGRLAYWWECFITPYMSYDAPAEPVQAAFRELTAAEKLPVPQPEEAGPDYLLRVRAHFQAMAESSDAPLAAVATMAVEDVDRVITPVMEIVAKPRRSLLGGDADVKFTLFTEDDEAYSPWQHRLLRLAIMFGMGAIAAWITVTLLYALRD